jgi:hypothetical protein
VSEEWILLEMQCRIRINAIAEYTRMKVLDLAIGEGALAGSQSACMCSSTACR